MKEISIHDIKNIRIGQAEDRDGGTGVTVLISETGMPVGLDVRGGGPASRESELLKPMAHADFVHAVVLGGGSAYGLDAAGGVMKYLSEHGIGLNVGVALVPLVCQSDLFDLTVADSQAHPDPAMGYAACVASENGGNYRDGNYGAGTGATIGKMKGMEGCMKSGIGSYAVQIGDVQVGAIVAVNALGDVYDHKTGKLVAGLLNEDHTKFADGVKALYDRTEVVHNRFVGNTTLGVILTNARFDKAQLCKIAGMAQNGYARSIRPVHTSADGDSIYALSLGDVEADKDVVGTLASEVMSEAILRAVHSAESAYGFPALRDLPGLSE